jgi:hypothetical protein
MISESSNKMMDSSVAKTKEVAESLENVTIQAVSMIKNRYHFPGVPFWEPLSVVASTIEEAESIWKKLRKPVNPEKEEKVEEVEKKTNNE